MRAGNRKPLAAVSLASLLLTAPATAASGACSYTIHADGYVIRIGGGSEGGGVGRVLKIPITLELRGGSARQLSAELTRFTVKRIGSLPAQQITLWAEGIILEGILSRVVEQTG